MRVLSILLLGLSLLIAGASELTAQPAREEPSAKTPRNWTDNIVHTQSARQHRDRQQALVEKLRGNTRGRVHRVGGRYVELEQTRHDRIFVVLTEFGDQVHPTYPGGTTGPLHNEIPRPEPDDNVTIWQADYGREHYRDMYFNRMLDYYRIQSSGRYGFDGDVTEWVKVPYNEARYGRNACGDIVCSNVWNLLRDGVLAWYADQIAQGRTADEIRQYLRTFDVWDRYDHDQDGDFDEPDGYIDHFQIVHAGVGEETGGGAQGEDAIWSHRWFAFTNLRGVAGPAGNLDGGIAIGESGIWLGDYTLQPENGGLGVFAHEFGHDLGLPDLYDTAGGENSTGFWTIMSAGSYGGNGRKDIGDRPVDFGAWEKLQLGWLNHDVSSAAQQSSRHRLGPAEFNTRRAQALLVLLPDRERAFVLGDPPQGNLAWWSGRGNDLDQSMVRAIQVPVGTPTLTMTVNYDIEKDWDYAYVSVSTDAGVTWANLQGNVTTNENPNGQNEGNGITGTSPGWVPATFDLSAYAGQTVLLRLRYWTDPFVFQNGILFDAITLDGFVDGAEAGDNGWELNGFRATDGEETDSSFHAYIAEYRQYRSYDRSLETGPYNFGFLPTRPDYVEHYPYQDGLLISYWDDYHGDNNTSVHPGEGLILPVDAHPDQLIRSTDGLPWIARHQSYDSTFGLEWTDALILHRNGIPTIHPPLPPEPVFDDRNDYYRPVEDSPAVWSPWTGVDVPPTGVQIRVESVSGDKFTMRVHVVREDDSSE